MWRDGVVEAVLDAGELAEHRVAADVQPRVVDDAPASARPRRAPRRRATRVAGRDRGAGGEQRVRGLVPRPVQPVVERAAAGGELQRVLPLAVVRDDVGEVVARSAPAGRRRRSRRPARPRRRRAGGPARGRPSTPRSTPRAAARRRGRAPGPRRPRRRARPGCAARRGCRRARSTPSRTRWRSSSARSGSCAAHQASAASMLARSARAKARCSAWRALRTPAVDDAAAAANHAACASRRAVGQPGVRHRLERERADAVEQPVAGAAPSSSTITSERLASRPTTSIAADARHVERLEHGLDGRQRRAAGERRPAPTGRAGRRGTAARSSSRSSPSAPGGAPACGWPGRSAR